MTLHWPQLTVLALYAFVLGVAAVENGKPKEGNESFLRTLVAMGISLTLLYFGGFFSGCAR